MNKAYFIAVLGVLAALIVCPVRADSITDTAQARLKLSDPKQNETKLVDARQNVEQSMKLPKSTTLVRGDEEKGVDCFYSENDDDPFCKKIKQKN